MLFDNEKDTKLLRGNTGNCLSKQNHKSPLADNTSADVSFLKTQRMPCRSTRGKDRRQII